MTCQSQQYAGELDSSVTRQGCGFANSPKQGILLCLSFQAASLKSLVQLPSVAYTNQDLTRKAGDECLHGHDKERRRNTLFLALRPTTEAIAALPMTTDRC